MRGTRCMAAALAALMLAGTVTGCGGNSGGKTDTAAGSEAAQTTAQAADKKESKDKKVLKLAGIVDPSVDEANKANYVWIQSAIDQFEEEYPDFKVEYEVYKYDQIDTKHMSDYQAGIEHGVSMVSDSQLSEHYKTGDLVDLTPYFDQWSKEEQDDFNWLNNLETFKNENKLYAIPLVMHARAIAYRKDLFEAAGLDPNVTPKTTEELLEYAQKLTKDGVYGLGMYLGNERATCEVSFAPYLWMNGGELWDPETKEAIYASEAGVKAAQFLSDLVNNYKVTPEFAVSGSYNDVLRTGFVNGQYAMAEGFGNYFFNVLEEEGLISGYMPATEDAHTDKVGLFLAPPDSQRYSNFWTLGISKTCPYPDEAMRLVELLIKPDNIKHYLNGIPVRQSAYENKAYSADLYQVMRQAAAQGKSMPQTANYMKLADSVAAAIQEIVLTKGDAKEILTRYQDEYNARYAGE